jgi:hypothetical protein
MFLRVYDMLNNILATDNTRSETLAVMELIGEDNKKPYQYMIFLVAISAIKYE